jgi:hypothetical protein
MKKVFNGFSIMINEMNPHVVACKYIHDKVAKLSGVSIAMNERKGYIKSYVKKVGMRVMKMEQLN